MNKSHILECGRNISDNLSTRTYTRKLSKKKKKKKKKKKIKPYGDSDVTLPFKTHDQNLQVCLKWETKIMLKQLFSNQNKEKPLKRLETKFYRREINIVSF